MLKACPSATSRRIIGKNIAARRKSLAMTQQGLAIAIGFSPRQMGRIERGEFSLSAELLPVLASALKLTDPLVLMKPEAFDEWI